MTEPTGTIPEQPETKPDSFSREYVSELRGEAKEWRTKFQETEQRLKQLEGDRERQTLEAKGDYDAALKKALDDAAQLGVKAKAAERYQTVINNLLEAQKKDVPEHVAALLEKLDPVDQLEWIAANADKLKPQAAQPAQAGQASFNPAGSKTNLTDRERIARLNNRRGVTSPF